MQVLQLLPTAYIDKKMYYVNYTQLFIKMYDFYSLDVRFRCMFYLMILLSSKVLKSNCHVLSIHCHLSLGKKLFLETQHFLYVFTVIHVESHMVRSS